MFFFVVKWISYFSCWIPIFIACSNKNPFLFILAKKLLRSNEQIVHKIGVISYFSHLLNNSFYWGPQTHIKCISIKNVTGQLLWKVLNINYKYVLIRNELFSANKKIINLKDFFFLKWDHFISCCLAFWPFPVCVELSID